MVQITRRHLFFGTAALAVVGLGAAWAVIPEDPGTAQYFAVDGVAIRGADPVAYFTQNAAVIGSIEHQHEWAGVTWHFASAAHRDLFVANPMAYAPQYGGYCAWAVAAKEQLFSVQPENWAVVDGKLYLNYSDGVERTWNTDRAGFIARGDAVWPDVREKLNAG